MSSSSSCSTEVLPSLQLLLQQKESVQIFNGCSTSSAPVPNSTSWTNPSSNTLNYGGLSIPPTFSPDGAYVCIVPVGSAIIRLCDGETNNLIKELACPDVMSMDFSPMGSFLVTWSRPTSGSSAGNLRVWDVKTGAVVIQYIQKVQKKNLIQWTHNEHVCMRIVSNEIHVLDGHAPGDGIKCKLFVKNVSLYSVACCGNYCDVACFIPSHSGNPSHITLYRVENTTISRDEAEVVTSWWPLSGSSDAIRPSTSALVSRSSMFNASDATLQWNSPLNNVCLVQVTSDVDSSGASYYGSTGAYLLACPPPTASKKASAPAASSTADIAAAITEQVALQVPQSKTGPIYTISWSPTGRYFILVGGTMPSNSTLYDMKGNALYEFGTCHRNTVIWSPHGRFFVIAGLGNLAGEVDFFELQIDSKSNKEKIKRLGKTNAHCAVQVGWSPDSRYFMTATLAPRMNVDNGFKIFKYNGSEVFSHECNRTDIKMAYHCTWRPAPRGLYPNRSRSPQTTGGEAVPVQPKPDVATAKPAPYRPPRSTGSLSNLLNRDSAPPTAAGKIQPAAAPSAVFKPAPYKPPIRTIPGMAAPKPVAAAPAAPKQKVKGTKAPAAAAAATPLPPAPPVADSAEDKEKRAKNLKKKLRQIDELEEKQKAGNTLTDEQKQKLASKMSVESELSKLTI